MDPIWQSAGLYGVPATYNFPDALTTETGLTLEERTARNAKGEPGRVDVAGYQVQYDESRKLWYCDLTINTFTDTYMPFVRLALVRYQPHALEHAKVSRVTLADFAQLTPDRSAMVTCDPHHPRSLRVVVSGIAPRGPRAVVHAEPRPQEISLRPTQIRVRVQERDTRIGTDLTWRDVAPGAAVVNAAFDDHVSGQPDLEMWAGTVTFAKAPEVRRFRLLIEEHEYISSNYALLDGRTSKQAGRLIYAEAFELDDALISEH
jgi:hypothetical protein